MPRSLLITFFRPAARAQVTGSISGSVVDSTGRVIVGAEVKLINEGTGTVRSETCNDAGSFVFKTWSSPHSTRSAPGIPASKSLRSSISS